MKKGFSDDKSFLFGVGLIGAVVLVFMSIVFFHYRHGQERSEELESIKASILQDFQLNLTKTPEKPRN